MLLKAFFFSIMSGNSCGLLAQLARAPRLHRGGRGFESLTTHHFLIYRDYMFSDAGGEFSGRPEEGAREHDEPRFSFGGPADDEKFSHDTPGDEAGSGRFDAPDGVFDDDQSASAVPESDYQAPLEPEAPEDDRNKLFPSSPQTFGNFEVRDQDGVVLITGDNNTFSRLIINGEVVSSGPVAETSHNDQPSSGSEAPEPKHHEPVEPDDPGDNKDPWFSNGNLTIGELKPSGKNDTVFISEGDNYSSITINNNGVTLVPAASRYETPDNGPGRTADEAPRDGQAEPNSESAAGSEVPVDESAEAGVPTNNDESGGLPPDDGNSEFTGSPEDDGSESNYGREPLPVDGFTAVTGRLSGAANTDLTNITSHEQLDDTLSTVDQDVAALVRARPSTTRTPVT